MLLDKLLAGAYGSAVTVFGLIAGKQAVQHITAVAHQWAGHINYFASWSN